MESYTTQSSGPRKFEGDHIINPASGHMRYSPSTKGVSVIRVVPCLDSGHPEPLVTDPSIIGPEGLSNALAEADVVTYFGPKGYSLICPGPVKGEVKGMVHHFADYIKDYERDNPISCPPDWRRWLGKKHEGDRTNPPRVLDRPSKHLLVQGYLLVHCGEVCANREGVQAPRWPVVLCMKASARKDFLDKVFTLLDGNAPWSDENNQIGDIVSLDGGHPLVVEPGTAERNGMTLPCYRIAVEPSAYPLGIEEARAVWRPWSEVLDLNPTMEEMATRLAMAFNADTVIRVFSGCPVYSQVCSCDAILRLHAAEQRGEGQAPSAPVYIQSAPQQPAQTQPAYVQPAAPQPAQAAQWPSQAAPRPPARPATTGRPAAPSAPARPAAPAYSIPAAGTVPGSTYVLDDIPEENDTEEPTRPEAPSMEGTIQQRLEAAKAKLNRKV